jgi:hypothetical protein
MAAPQVTNVAAKLFALRPGLTVGQVRQGIVAAAEERRIGGRTIRLLHPARAVEALSAGAAVAERLQKGAARLS